METVRRPFGISVLVFLAALGGAFSILGGVLLLFDHDDSVLQQLSLSSENQLRWYAVGTIVFGVVYVLLALALERGSEVVRILFAIFALLNLAWGLWYLVALGSEQRVSGAFQTCFAILVLYLLFNHRSQEWFERRHEL